MRGGGGRGSGGGRKRTPVRKSGSTPAADANELWKKNKRKSTKPLDFELKNAAGAGAINGGDMHAMVTAIEEEALDETDYNTPPHYLSTSLRSRHMDDEEADDDDVEEVHMLPDVRRMDLVDDFNEVETTVRGGREYERAKSSNFSPGLGGHSPAGTSSWMDTVEDEKAKIAAEEVAAARIESSWCGCFGGGGGEGERGKKSAATSVAAADKGNGSPLWMVGSAYTNKFKGDEAADMIQTLNGVNGYGVDTGR